ncbi:MAG: EAL domain-containing protein [Sedimenticola sp.]
MSNLFVLTDKTLKDLLRLFSLLLYGFAVTPLTCFDAAAQNAMEPSASTQSSVRLQLKWRHAFQFAGYYAAHEKGYFREKGLDVTILEHKGKASPIEVMLKGGADYAVSGSDVVIERAKGRPVVALATIFQHSAYAFLVSKASGIERAEDLAGRRVMIGSGVQDAALQALLRRAGVDDEDLIRLQTSFDIQSLIKGDTDAFNAYITDQAYLLQKAGVQFNHLLPKHHGVDFYGDTLVTTEKEIREHPERVKAFREASLKGWEYALKHPNELINLISGRYNTQKMSWEHLSYEARTSQELIQPLLVPIGFMHPDRWLHIKEIFEELGFIPPNSSIAGLIYEEKYEPAPRWALWIEKNWLVFAAGTVMLCIAILLLILLQMQRVITQKTFDLEESKQRYRTVFDAAPEGIWLIDRDRKTLRINECLSRILGYSESEMLGKTPMDFADQENRAIFLEQTAKISTTERRSYEIALKHKDGHNIATYFSAVTLHNPDNSVMSALAFVRDITERKAIEIKLRESEKHLRTLIDAEPACVKTVDKRGRLISMNAAGLAMFDAQSIDQISSTPIVELVDKAYRKEFSDFSQQVFEGKPGTLIFKATGLSGRSLWLETHAVPFRDPEGKITRLLGVTHDVTQRIEMEQELKDESDFLQNVIDGIGDSIMVIDANYEVQLMNDAARESYDTHFSADATHPKCFEIAYQFNAPCSGDDHPCPLKTALRTGKRASVIHGHMYGDDVPIRLELVTSPLHSSDGSLKGVIEVSRDITDHLELLDEVRQQKDHLNHLAHHDSLTNLPNRVLFLDRLEQTISKSRRAHEQVAIFFIDLDQFKQINDSFGHAFGDRVLEEVAVRFNQCVRENDTVARLGGDEFTIIMDALHTPQHATAMAQKLINSLEHPFVIDKHQFYLTASIGISLFPQDGRSADTLLRNADTAMYKAKDEGRNTFQYYTENMTEQAFERILMEVSLRNALKKDELAIYYQPQFNSTSGNLIGMEALVRWQHPELGLVVPARFIPLAEETGLIIQIGEWMLRSACRQIVEWKRQGFNPVKVAVNLSAKQLGNENLLSSINEILEETGCDPTWLELEVTEGYLMKKPEQSIYIMGEIRELGIDLAIDDFGTGYSSLAYLKRFPITRLKIDGSFVRDIPDDPEDMAITRAVIALGKSLNLDVIAEGVETERQQAFLANEGCHHVQGFLYSRPVPAIEASHFLSKNS